MLIMYFLLAFCGLYNISFYRAKRMSLPSITHLFFNHFDRPGKIIKSKRLIEVDIVFPVYVLITGLAFSTDKNHLDKPSINPAKVMPDMSGMLTSLMTISGLLILISSRAISGLQEVPTSSRNSICSI